MEPLHGRSDAESALQARDVVAFGQEFGRVLSDGRIVGRAEPFAKVFPSSRGVKREVGLVAWAILEDIALDATLDGRGRLVADTNVRRIAANLGLNKDTVTRHLARLREYGFVLHEETRADASGRYETCHYVLDPSACIERFTVTPSRGEASHVAPNGRCDAATPTVRPVERETNPATPPGADGDASGPCPKSSDTVAVSVFTGHGGTGHGDLGQKYLQEVEVVEEQPPPATRLRTDLHAREQLVEALTDLGLRAGRARRLVADHPAERIREVLAAAERRQLRSPAGWVAQALQDGWDMATADPASSLKATRERAHSRVQATQGLLDDDPARAKRERHGEGWAAAISAALDDRQLPAAIAQVTTPVAGLDRQSVPVVRAQLIAWAVGVHAAHPSLPLSQALTGALRGQLTPRSTPPARDRELPPPPALPPTAHAPALSERLAALLQRAPPERAAPRDRDPSPPPSTPEPSLTARRSL